VAFDNLRNNLDGTSSAAADAFAGLVELEDKSAEFAGIWQGLGAEVQFRGIQADVEEFRTAFDQVLEGLGPEAAQKIVDGLRAQNEALDKNSDQYKTNASELSKSQEAIDERRDAILKATIAERDQKRATQEATEEYDRQTGTVEGISDALEDVRDFLKLTTIEFEANAAAARGFTESLERSTFQDEQIGAALNFNEAMGKALTTVGALPDELDAAKIALVGVGEQSDDTGEKALGAFLAIGDQTSKLLSTFIQAGDPEGARNLATILRAQVIQALQDQGITDPQRVDELLGLVGLQDVQIEAAIRFANAEEEILRVQTLLALFETALNEAPAELLLQISAQIGAGDLEGATTTIRNWVAATSDDPATSEIGLAALINQFPDQQLQDIISKARDYAGANPIELRATFNQSKAVIDTISAIAGVVAAANNYLDAVVQQNIESGNLSDVGYQELVQNRDINGNGVIGRAIGGPVNERTPYMVGERGPELFVPNAAGRIVPTNELGGGQSVNITQNITTGDPILTAAEVVRRQRDAEFLAGV
jgi:hypothetical protein